MQGFKALALSLLLAAAAIAQDAALTPGAVDLHMTTAKVCSSGFSATRRHTSRALKDRVYEEYRIRVHILGDYEIDHRVPLSLAGADVLANLWAQSYSGPWNAHLKDALEDRIHAAVCHSHTLTLAQGQRIFLGDWRAAYVLYFPKGKP